MKLLSQDKDLMFRIGQVKDLVRTKTARQSGTVFAGNVISTTLTVVSTIFLSRSLGPTNYGVLAIFLSIYTMILGITDFGLGTTAIKLISSNLESNPHKAHVIEKVIIWIEIFSGIVVGVIGVLFSGLIAKALGGDYLLFPIRMAFLAGVFASIGAFIGPFLSAHQKFFRNAAFGASTSLFKTIGVISMFVLMVLSLNNVIVFYTLINILALIIGFLLVPKGYGEKSTRTENKKAFREVFHFSKWILLSYFASVIASRLDIFLIARYRGPEDVGFYAAAQQLAQIMPLLIGAITTVLLPRISKMKKKKEFMGYVKKVLLGTVVLNICLIPVLLFGQVFIHIIFGSKFSGSITLFKMLFFGFMIALIVNPLSIIFYAKNKPKVLTAINYITLVFTVVLNFLLIPLFGAYGAAGVFIISNILSALIIIPLSIREARHGSLKKPV